MQNYPGTVQSTFIRQGASLARGTIVDGFLSDDDNALVYAAWQPSWPEPLGFAGGITAITCEMVMEVPEDEFIAAFGKKKASNTAAKRIREIARQNAGR